MTGVATQAATEVEQEQAHIDVHYGSAHRVAKHGKLLLPAGLGDGRGVAVMLHRMGRVLVALLWLSSAGCWGARAKLGAIAPGGGVGYELLGSDAVVGESCESSMRDGKAFAAALSKVPGAQLLIRAELSDHGKCAVVLGLPAKYAENVATEAPEMAATSTHDGRPVPPDQALVYLYRYDVGRNKTKVEVELGGGQFRTVPRGSVELLMLPPGKHSGHVRFDRETQRLDPIELAAGHVYYLRVSTTVGDQPGIYYLNSRRSLAIEVREPAFARTELRLLKQQ